jgi:hypothetical protein
LLKRELGSLVRWLLIPVLLATVRVFASADLCAVCGKEIIDKYYTWEDKVMHVKQKLCSKCEELPNNCYLCSMPVLRNFKSLPDGRVFCSRDVRFAVLEDSEAVRICEQVKEALDRQFIRFTTFPVTNVTVELMDRVAIQEIYKFAGHDYTCPNMWGCTRSKTNHQQVSFQISLLSGLPRDLLVSTYVHESAHTWHLQNLSPEREKTIGEDAIEGFCELVAFLYAAAQGNESAKATILANHYTRGQIQLFIEAERRYGFNDIVDWMKSGSDSLLMESDLSRVRLLEPPPKPPQAPKTETAVTLTTNVAPATNVPVAFPETLVLKSIGGTTNRRLAIINHRTLAVGESARFQLAKTNWLVRCLEIRTNSVVIQVEETGAKQELFLPSP